MRNMSLNDWIKSIGGFLILLLPILIIGLIWFDMFLFLKLIFTDITLILVIYALDKITENDTKN